VGGLVAYAAATRVGAPQITAGAWVALALFFGSAAITVILAGAVRELLVQLAGEIQARKAAEEHQAESENRFRILADAAPTPMWVTNPDGSRGFVNRAYMEFFGLSETESAAHPWTNAVHPDDLDRLRADLAAGESSSAPFVLEARYRRADGEWRWLRSLSRPRMRPDGHHEGFIGIGFDVTDAKQAQADLTRINELLAERMEAALAERDEAQHTLMQAQKLEALGQLTGGVAHDFNNLLTVIMGALDIIIRKPEDTTRLKRMAEAALAAARRGENMTQRLLAFSRRQPQSSETCRPDDLLRENEPLLQRAVGEGVILRLELHAPNMAANLDPSQFEAAILNLVVNARDAIKDGGHIGVSTSVLDLPAKGERPAGQYVCVAVTDDGEGMDEVTRAHVFEPFFTTKPVGKGTGLGLSQVYGFTRQSGGSAEIESAPGKGTTIRLFLPAVEMSGEAEIKPVADSESINRKLKVLLVEDDPDVAELVEAMLRELGHSVVPAFDARSALTRAASEPDLGLMLTDVIMPGGKSGVELAHEITRLRPGLPVILSSGYTGETLAGAERAPWPLLRKPYSIETLSSMITETVRTGSLH
jgi:PAS domain S-box-containing protein